MKKLLLLLLCVPLIGLGQGTINCSLLTLTDVEIDNSNLTIDFTIYNGNPMDIHESHIAYTIDNNGDTIQGGNPDSTIMFSLNTSYFQYPFPNSVSPSYPLSIYFVYDNLGGLGWDTCIIVYNNTTSSELIFLNNINEKKLIKVTDILGRETKDNKNIFQFYIYDDGTIEKKIIIE